MKRAGHSLNPCKAQRQMKKTKTLDSQVVCPLFDDPTGFATQVKSARQKSTTQENSAE
jgi:hypothetical protein